ncbi:apolipoprotein A-I [Platysternon megacephalum]|uniref:Apolipoprotein A-I n=1 Tax=Platysternon megacephalum TaxID=55544 RepID=A0A4D9E1G2_9SAUR|nr:apolipoprotein A-I [Platysternon megacephalum]
MYWISVESKAVCKTAKIQTEMTHFLKDGCSIRGHTVCHGSQYKLESKSEMYYDWKARGTSYRLLSKSKLQLRTSRRERCFSHLSQHSFEISLLSVSNTGSRSQEFPNSRQHSVNINCVCNKLDKR